MISRSAAMALMFLLFSSVVGSQTVDLRVPFDRLMDEGQVAYEEGRYEEAATAFRDARLLRPQSPEAIMNLGLAQARLDQFEAARELFRESRRYLSPQDMRRAESIYNEGTAWLDEAASSLSSEETAADAPEQLIEAIGKFGEALAINPDHEQARRNRTAAQRILSSMIPPPPNPQSGQSDDENDEGEGSEEGESDPQNTSPSEGGQQDPDEESETGESGEQQQNPSQNPPESDEQSAPPEQGDPQQGDEPPPDEQPGDESEQEPPPNESEQEESEASEAQGAGAAQEQPGEMTPEEARQLLNLLGNRDLMIFRQPRDSRQPPGGRDW